MGTPCRNDGDVLAACVGFRAGHPAILPAQDSSAAMLSGPREDFRDIFRAELETRMTALIEGATYQITNQYGEKKSPPKTLREMCADRAQEYLNQQVDAEGRPKRSDSYNWNASTTMAGFLVSKTIRETVDKELRGALINANASIAGGIEASVKASLEDLSKRLRVGVFEDRK